MPMEIARRLREAKADARMAGKHAIRARINPRDKQELVNWVTRQNHTDNHLAQHTWNADRIWDMDIVTDEKVGPVIVLEFQ